MTDANEIEAIWLRERERRHL